MPALFSPPIVVLAPDSFKGSLDAARVAAALAAGVLRARADAIVRLCPMADGGEGTLDALLAGGGVHGARGARGVRRVLNVSGASGAPLAAATGLLADGSAVIETAAIVGITDPVGMSAPVQLRSTRGIGEALRVLLDAGVRRFFVALGGSSTNDGGAGLLAGLGARFLDARGRVLDPTPQGLAQLARIDASQLDDRLVPGFGASGGSGVTSASGVTIVGMSDVDNPLTGPQGATAVFGAQKGVTPERVAPIDATLGHYADLLEAALGRTARDAAGAGAAGGLGFALRMLGARIEPGAETVARQIDLDAALTGAHWLITGEGRSDAQTLHGKAPFVAGRHARAAHVPATLLSGALDPAALPRLAAHFAGCFSIAPGPVTLEAAIRDAEAWLANAAEQLTRLKFGRNGRVS